MTKLSVNINKIATLRNSRGGNNPDVVKAALDIERFGADGITVHPRPDERHIRYNDVRELKTFFVDGKKPKKEEEEQPVEVPESLVKAVERQIPKDQAERKDLFMGTTV